MRPQPAGHNGDVPDVPDVPAVPDVPDVPDAATPEPPAPDEGAPEPEGGESACWLHLCCADCGTIEGEPHRPGCGAADQPRAAMYFA
jgi:hypothetical protein